MKRELIFPTEIWYEDATWMSQIYDTPFLLDKFQTADQEMIYDWEIDEDDLLRDEENNLIFPEFSKDYIEIIRYLHTRFEKIFETNDYKVATGIWPIHLKWNLSRNSVIQTCEGIDWRSILFLKVPDKVTWPGYASYGNRMIFRDPRHRSIMSQERFVNSLTPSQRTKWELEIKENMLVVLPGHLEYYMEGDGLLSVIVDWKIFNHKLINRCPNPYSLYWDGDYVDKAEYKFMSGLGQHLKKELFAETTPPEDDI